jgi:hypothetical protein
LKNLKANYLLQEKAAIKWMIIPFFLLLVNSASAQQEGNGQTELKNASLQILNQKITFIQEAGSLESNLQKLSSENKIRFSYSNDRVRNIDINRLSYTGVTVASLLESLLSNTGLDYLVVGTMIVITEKQQVYTDSDKNNDVPVDTSVQIVQGKEKSATGNHVFVPGNSSMESLPWKMRRELYKIYRQELRLAAKRKPTVIAEDSIRKPILLPPSFFRKNYFVSGSLSACFYRIKFRSEIPDWQKKLRFSYNYRPEVVPALSAGIIRKNILISAGINYQTLRFAGGWAEPLSVPQKVVQDSATNGSASNTGSNGKGKAYAYGKNKDKNGNFSSSPGTTTSYIKNDTLFTDFFDKYTMFSFPIQIQLSKEWDRIFIAGGPSINVGILNTARVQKNKFKSVYENLYPSGVYTEKKILFTLGAGVSATAGFLLNNYLAFAVSSSLNFSVTPLQENSVYRMYADNLNVGVTCFYLFNKTDLKQLKAGRKF